jgi:voltage-gated potassium channel
MKIKNTVYDILANNEKKGFIYVIDDYFISGLILLNIIAIVLETYDPLFKQYFNYFHAFDIFSVVVFTIEYILRIWISDLVFPDLKPWRARSKYIFSFLGTADLLAILPFYLPFIVKLDLRVLRIVRLFRLFRIFKLAHYSDSIQMVITVLKAKKYELFITVFGTVIILLLAASIMFHLEHEMQPEKFPNIFSSLWWAVATLTTIGYGDVFPVTGWGQILAALTALFGIGLVAIPTSILSMGFMEELEKKKQKKLSKTNNNQHIDNKDSKSANNAINYNYCPHCGEKLR